MEIVSNRISATPRSKYVRYGYGGTYISGSGNSGSANVDLSNYVKLTGETEQTIEGNVLATGDLVAYSTGQSVENYPIASSTALGMIKVGKNLTIDEDGTLNAKAGGVSNWNEIQGKPTLLTDTNIKKWNDNSHTHLNKAILDKITADSIHTHSNKSYLDSINQNLSKTSDVNFGSVKATGDIIAYSTGISAENYPIASSTALGCIKVGNNLSITSDGTLSAQAGGVTSWNELKDKPTTLAGYGITDAAKASDLTSHTGNTTVHITATERTNWNDANSKKHTHTNKTVLDGITSTNVSNWNSAYSNLHTHSNKTVIDGISSINVSNWNTAYTNNHTHNNKSVLDGITSTNITNWNDANSKKHTHSNKSYLDVINQNLATTSDVTFAGVKSTGDVVAYSTGSGDITLPIASSSALGAIKVGSGLTITSDGTLSATGAGSIGQITVSGTGNVITNATKNGNTVTFTKDVTALTTANYTSTLDSKYLKLTGGTLTGALTATKFTSNIANGTAPIAVTSKTVCTNLNADLLDGYNANGLFTSLANSGNNISVAIGGTTKTLIVGYASNADQLDGYHASSLESYKLTVIDASGLNHNTWYPVTMAIGNSLQTRIRIEGNTAANASWNSRSDKMMSLILDYTVNGSNWGWTSPFRTVNAYQEGAGCNKCLRGLGQLTNSSTEYVYVRGGAKYNFYVSRFITPVLRTSTYTVSSQSVAPTTTEPAAIVRNAALTSDNVATATKLQTARTINGTSFDGSANITTTNWGTARNIYIADSTSTNTGTGVSVNGSANATLKLPATIKASLTGNATTATTLQTARTINGTSFNGSSNITTANWGTARNIYIADSSGTNTGTAVSVNGSGNATLKLPASIKASLTGNASTATTLQTARTIWGQSFNGSKNVSGDMTGVGSITASGTIRTTADVVAYSTGTSSAPFKYWYPSVNSSGDLSWTDSTSTTKPTTVNIKGAKGDKGTSVSSITQTTTSTADGGTNKITCKLSDGTTTTFSIKNGSKGSTGATGPQGPQGPAGPTGPATDTYTNIYLKNTSWPTVYFKANSASGAIYLHARGNDSGLYSLYIAHGTNSNHNQSFASNGNVWFRGSLTQNSDIRLKNRLDNVTNVLYDLNDIQAFKYTLKGDDSNTVKIGLSAQDLLKVYPELVELSPTDIDGNKYYSVNYSCLSVIALQACKELHQLVKNQQAKIDELEQRLAIIESKNNEL